MGTVLVVIVVFLILCLSEYLSRYKGVHSELTRKLTHSLVGIFVAFWPFFLTWRQIQLLSVAFLVVVLISIKLNIFKSIHAVKRNVHGEILFAMVIGILALILTDEWIFMASMLILGISDGLAAIVGLAFGDNNSYKVLGHTKSLAGSLAFFFSALIIMIVYTVLSGAPYSGLSLILLPAIAAVAENFAVNGTDNLVIPLLVALVLTSAV